MRQKKSSALNVSWFSHSSPPLITDLYLCLLFSRSPQNISLSRQICLRLWLSLTRGRNYPECHRSLLTSETWDIVTDHYIGPGPQLRSLNSQPRLRFSDIFTFCIELNKMGARVNGSLRPLRETESCHGPQQYIVAATRILLTFSLANNLTLSSKAEFKSCCQRLSHLVLFYLSIWGVDIYFLWSVATQRIRPDNARHEPKKSRISHLSPVCDDGKGPRALLSGLRVGTNHQHNSQPQLTRADWAPSHLTSHWHLESQAHSGQHRCHLPWWGKEISCCRFQEPPGQSCK